MGGPGAAVVALCDVDTPLCTCSLKSYCLTLRPIVGSVTPGNSAINTVCACSGSVLGIQYSFTINVY